MKIVCICSGGLDSTVLAYEMHSQKHEISLLSFDYGQKHRKELRAAESVGRHLGVPHRTVLLGGLRDLLRSSLTDESQPVPKGHYEAENMKSTVVPFRNLIMLVLAAGHAVSTGATAVAYAAHGGDHAIYPDCRETFVEAAQVALDRGHYTAPLLMAPYLMKKKHDIVKIGAELKVPLGMTWSCYEGQADHCGKCGTCVERKEAFKLAEVFDPTIYEA